MTPLLEVSDVVIRFPIHSRIAARLTGQPSSIEAVAGVSFTLEAGSTYALVGESGSGKTTLARAITGLVPIEGGQVDFAGRTISGLSEAALRGVRREIAMIFQDPIGSLSPRLSVRAILAEPFKVHGETADLDGKIARLLDDVGLSPHFAQRYPHQLSGGQARRVSIARALALRPKLVIADEPTAGLDVSIQGEMLNLMRDLQRKFGTTFLMITHNLNVVRHVADRMAVMYLGRIVEEGLTDDIFKAPRHRYTTALLSANLKAEPEAASYVIEAEGETPSLLNRPKGCEFHPRCLFKREVCRTAMPEEQMPSADHRFACHNPA
ncbi:ABC transporter ATP-binding protein [Aestuariivirga sp. YIM B02566]|uniref:ABC transporter ATP-binding protein n=1 Tax=Taklimakanibacter albus TaxID=2800327 RepID=UPI001FF01C47|nr:ABC transporter ATP-binding protein [Aestuariivirga sp. YIM B02566]